METLYAPTRRNYLKGLTEGVCPFCTISQEAQRDDEYFVFYRDSLCFGVMNLYPYTPGHLMFIPHLHVDSPDLLSEESWKHLSSLVRQGCEMLYAFGARGINVGINIRGAGGAGIPDHLHWHLVPRFDRDTNFMTSIAQTRIYGCDFREIFEEMKQLSQKYLGK